MEKQYQVRKDAGLVIALIGKGKIMVNTEERAYIEQAVNLYDFALETGEMTPKQARSFLRKALNKTLKFKTN